MTRRWPPSGAGCLVAWCWGLTGSASLKVCPVPGWRPPPPHPWRPTPHSCRSSSPRWPTRPGRNGPPRPPGQRRSPAGEIGPRSRWSGGRPGWNSPPLSGGEPLKPSWPPAHARPHLRDAKPACGVSGGVLPPPPPRQSGSTPPPVRAFPTCSPNMPDAWPSTPGLKPPRPSGCCTSTASRLSPPATSNGCSANGPPRSTPPHFPVRPRPSRWPRCSRLSPPSPGRTPGSSITSTPAPRALAPRSPGSQAKPADWDGRCNLWSARDRPPRPNSTASRSPRSPPAISPICSTTWRVPTRRRPSQPGPS